MTPRATRIGLAVAAVLAVLSGLLVAERLLNPPLTLKSSGIYLRGFEPLDGFHLIHQSGQPFTAANLRGKWSFLYFGYTYCPDICPLTLVELNQLQKQLAARGADQETAYLLISVDPQRDTPERLRDYVAYFNPKFQGVTGSYQELERLAKPLRVFYKRQGEPNQTAGYAIDHTSTVILVDPAGRPRVIFNPPQKPEQMLEDFLQIRFAAP